MVLWSLRRTARKGSALAVRPVTSLVREHVQIRKAIPSIVVVVATHVHREPAASVEDVSPRIFKVIQTTAVHVATSATIVSPLLPAARTVKPVIPASQPAKVGSVGVRALCRLLVSVQADSAVQIR